MLPCFIAAMAVISIKSQSDEIQTILIVKSFTLNEFYLITPFRSPVFYIVCFGGVNFATFGTPGAQSTCRWQPAQCEAGVFEGQDVKLRLRSGVIEQNSSSSSNFCITSSLDLIWLNFYDPFAYGGGPGDETKTD